MGDLNTFDYETRHAMDVIIRAVIARLIDEPDTVGEMWEDFPEIGEHDWIEICEQVAERAKSFINSPEVFKAAYEHLASRADH